MHEVYRHKLNGAETSVDTTNELVYSCAQILVLLDVLSRGHGELHKDDFSDPLRVLGEEEFKCVELLRNALDVVKSVDTDDDLDAVEALLKGSDTLLNGLFLQVLRVKEISSKRNATMDAAKKTRTLIKEVGSIPIGKVPTWASRPSNSTPFGIVGSERMRVQEERKCRA